MPEEQLQVFHAGMNDILLKPITEQVLMEMFAHWIEKHDNTQAVDQQPSPEQGEGGVGGDTATEYVVYSQQESIDLAGGNESLASELLPMLISDLPAQHEKIQQAYAKQDIAALKAHVHKLHGSTQYCGVPALRHATAKLEQIIDQQQLQQLEQAIRQLSQQIETLLNYYKVNFQQN